MTLILEYVRSNSEAAFATLVSRHVNLVYSVAMRQVGNAHLAEEITQKVFIVLAQKAKSLDEETIVPGWLCRTTHNITRDTVKAERRRQLREQEAMMWSAGTNPESPSWERIAPLIDEALSGLGKSDQDAIVLRFFEDMELKQIGGALGITEDAARMRVNRAVEKLRHFFHARGLSISAAALAGAVLENSIQTAPPALAKTVSIVAIGKGAAAGASTSTLVKGALKIMAWTKTKTIAVVAVVTIAGISATTVAVKQFTKRKVVAATYPGDWIWEPNSQTLERVPPIFLLRPSTLPAKPVPPEIMGKDRYSVRGKTLKGLIALVWSQKNSALKIRIDADLPEGTFDFIVAGQAHWWNQLQSEIDQRFRLVERVETDNTVVVRNSNKP